ncbi:YbaB/EbfC family nucleoid-associated protein [bacterium]|nr:YbaB/EbfC family nucleoid-associated protein [bacterium]
MKFPGGGGMGGMLAQAQKMQSEMKALQDKLALKEFDIESAGGRIKITITGKQEITALDISKEIIDPEDPGMLADMLKVAVNQAVEESQRIVAEEMGKVVPPGLAGLL